jgi:ascorbate-specific PTS system EIIC-type component UlaA
MRNKTNGSRISMVMAAALGFLMLSIGSAAYAGTDSLTVKNVSVSGGVVQVTVRNASLSVQSTSVQVEAEVDGVSSFSLVPVVLLPGQTATVSAAFTGNVTSVTSVGLVANVVADMNDDPLPM